MFCRKCGKELPESARRCGGCSTLVNADRASSKAVRVTAIIGMLVVVVLVAAVAFIAGGYYQFRRDLHYISQARYAEAQTTSLENISAVTVEAKPSAALSSDPQPSPSASPGRRAPRRASKDASSNEAWAVADLRTIVTAQITYMTINQTGFADDLSQLAQAGLIAADLATGELGGYRFTVSTSGSRNETFVVTATPVHEGVTGVRSFCSNETAVIRVGSRADNCDPTSSPRFR